MLPAAPEPPHPPSPKGRGRLGGIVASGARLTGGGNRSASRRRPEATPARRSTPRKKHGRESVFTQRAALNGILPPTLSHPRRILDRVDRCPTCQTSIPPEQGTLHDGRRYCTPTCHERWTRHHTYRGDRPAWSPRLVTALKYRERRSGR